MMGSQSVNARKDESPITKVTIIKSLAFAKFETTFLEYDKFALATGRSFPKDNGFGRGQKPVINVTLSDAKEFAQWLSESTHQLYRLPTEAEWEYAARSGISTDYISGSTGQQICLYANVADLSVKHRFPNWFSTSCSDSFPTTSDVGSLRRNAFGLYDMQGNVSEWTDGCYTSAPSNTSVLNNTGCKLYVARGGSWRYLAKGARFSRRYFRLPKFKGDAWGFRLVRDIK